MSRLARFAPPVSIALAAVAAHATALAGGFVWLDHAHIEEGLAVGSLVHWRSPFATGFAGTGFYRPLMALSLAIDAALGGSPLLYHLCTLLWHGAAAVMTFVAARSLRLSRRAAFVAGLLLAVHPAASLVAGAIAFRSEAMIAVALLGLVAAHRARRPVWAAVALLGGALTKETALVLGPLFVATLEWEATRQVTADDRGAPSSANRRARLTLLGAEAAALAVAVGLRLAFAPPWRATFASMTPGEAVGTRAAMLGRTALLALAPVSNQARSICDTFPITSIASPWTAFGFAVGAALAWLAWRRRGPALLLALALLPSLNLVPVMRWWSPHYLYVGLAFAAMLVAEGFEVLARRAARRASRRAARLGPNWAVAGAAALAIAMAALAAHDGLRFRTDETLWTSEVERQPGCREGQFYLGEVARERRDWTGAIDRYGQAVVENARVLSYVDRGAALQNLGAVHLERGDLAEARATFEAALVLPGGEERRRRLTHNLATTELRAGQPERAAALLDPESSREDAFPESLFIRVQALRALGRGAEADALGQRLAARLSEARPRP